MTDETHVSNTSLHKLNGTWKLWAHLPHDTNWNIESYKNIFTFETAESTLSILDILPNNLIKNCMLFIMRDNIKPIWEDERNRNGGCFSYKINNKVVVDIWKSLVKKLLGETLLKNSNDMNKINGITISPKRNFCIIKLWLKDCTIQNPMSIVDINGLSRQGCLFKKHNPEF